MTLESLLPQLGFQRPTEEAVTQKLRNSRSHVEAISETAYSSDDFDFPLCKQDPLTRLAVVTYLLVQKYPQYRRSGATDEIILDTFRDVSLRANLYHKNHGKIGISKEDVIWFRHIMNIHIFKIGVLQFQPFSMVYLDEETLGEPYMAFSRQQKLTLPSGTPVINCHVQKGADIHGDLVEKSFAQAKIFFRDCFPNTEYKAFLCYSWLLYPPMLTRLPEGANIRQYAGHFSIIGFCNDPEQALENIFGTAIVGKLTSLQRLAKEHAEFFGFGCGIIDI